MSSCFNVLVAFWLIIQFKSADFGHFSGTPCKIELSYRADGFGEKFMELDSCQLLIYTMHIKGQPVFYIFSYIFVRSRRNSVTILQCVLMTTNAILNFFGGKSGKFNKVHDNYTHDCLKL